MGVIDIPDLCDPYCSHSRLSLVVSVKTSSPWWHRWMYSHSDVRIRVVPFGFRSLHQSYQSCTRLQQFQSLYRERQASHKPQLSNHDSLYLLSVLFKMISFISVLWSIAEVIKSITQLKVTMCPHLDCVGLGSGLFLNIAGGKCWFSFSFYPFYSDA